MKNKSIKKLIVKRGFEHYKDGFQSRLVSRKIDCKFDYVLGVEKPALRLDVESKFQIGRVTLWVTGECDLEVLN